METIKLLGIVIVAVITGCLVAIAAANGKPEAGVAMASASLIAWLVGSYDAGYEWQKNRHKLARAPVQRQEDNDSATAESAD